MLFYWCAGEIPGCHTTHTAISCVRIFLSTHPLKQPRDAAVPSSPDSAHRASVVTPVMDAVIGCVTED